MAVPAMNICINISLSQFGRFDHLAGNFLGDGGNLFSCGFSFPEQRQELSAEMAASQHIREKVD